MNGLMKYALLIVGFMALTTSVSAQKFGYLNSAALLQEMPKVKEAEANLETLQKQLQDRGKKMVEEFQAKFVELDRKNKAGEITPKDLDTESQKLKGEEQKIAEYEQEMQKQLFEKREALLQPILDDVNNAIKDVAEANGYAYIFDASPGTGVLLYADEATDVYDLVKAKLGL